MTDGICWMASGRWGNRILEDEKNKIKIFCFNNVALHDYFKKQMLPEKNFTLHSLVKLYEILLDRKIKIRNNPNPYTLWLTPFPHKIRNTLKGPLKTSLDKLEFTQEFIHRILKHPCNNHITFHTILITYLQR